MTRIEGSIDQPGEQDRYEFVVTEKTRFLFDGVQGDQIQWKLSGPGANNQFDYRDLLSTGDRSLELRPGTYTLTVDGTNDKTGLYEFRLIGVEGAKALVAGEHTTGILQPGTQAALYSVHLDAGDRLFFQADADNSAGTWTLFDPVAAAAWNLQNLQYDSSVFTAQRTGLYWLSVEGQSGATTTANYGFTLFRHAARNETLTLGQTHTVELSSPGDAITYTLDVDEATQIQWDQLSASLPNVQWTLLDANTGNTLASANLDVQDGVRAPTRLVAGRYLLRIEGVNRGAGTVSFRLLASTQAALAPAQVPTSNGSALGGQVVRIDATEAGQLSLAYSPLPDDPDHDGPAQGAAATRWMLTDAFGTNVGTGSLGVGEAVTVALSRPGSYYLWTNPSLDTGARRGELLLAQWAATAPATLTLDNGAAQNIAGELLRGQTLATELTVSASGVWLLTPGQIPEGAQWRLTGARGVEFDWSTPSTAQAQARYLSPGVYRLEIRTTGLSAGAYAIATTPFAAATALTSGVASALPTLTLGQSVLLRADAAPTDAFAVAFSAHRTDFALETFDAFGRVLALDGADRFTQGQARGPVYLRVTRIAIGSGTTTLTLTRTLGNAPAPVTGQAIELGAEIDAGPSAAAAPNFHFDLAQDGMLFIEWRGASYSYFELSGPRGVEASDTLSPWNNLSDAFGNSHTWPSTLSWTPAGRYSLSFTNTQDPFSFTVHSAAQAEVITSGERIRRTLGADQALALFAFDAHAANDYQLDGLIEAGEGNFFALYDANGQQVLAGDPSTDTRLRFNPPRDGRYTLALYRGQGYGELGSPELDFTLSETAHIADLAQALGTLPAAQAATIQTSLTAAGQKSVFSFELSEGGLWMIDTGAAFDGAGWSLAGPDGPLGSGTFGASAPQQNGVFNLVPGHYELSISGGARSTSGEGEGASINPDGIGNAELRLVPFAAATPVASGLATDLGAIAPGQTALVRVALTPYDTIRLDLGALANEYRLVAIDADGHAMSWEAWADEIEQLTWDSRPGPAYLLLARQYNTYDGLPTAAADAHTTLTVDVQAGEANNDGRTPLALNEVADSATPYVLSVTQPGLLFLDVDANDAASLSISGLVDPYQWSWPQDIWNGEISTGAWYPPIQAHAGDYHIDATGWGSPVNWRIVSNAGAPVLTPGQAVDTQLAAGHNLALYNIDLARGDLFRLTPDAGAGEGNHYWLVNEAGALVAHGDPSRLGEAAPISRSGRYTLMLSRHVRYNNEIDLRGDGHFAFSVQRTALGETIERNLGTLDATAATGIDLTFTADHQRATVRFDVATPSAWVFSGLTGVAGQSFSLSRTDRDTENDGHEDEYSNPYGDDHFNALNWTELSAGTRTLFLMPGQYELSIDSLVTGGSALSLQLTPLAAAQTISAGQNIDLAGMAVNEARLYALDVLANEHIQLQSSQATSPDYEVEFLNAFGHPLIERQALENLLGMDSAHAGTVYLRVSRIAANQATAPVLQLARTAGTPAEVPSQALTLGVPTHWDPTSFAFEFDQTADGWIALEWQQGDWTHWTLTGPAGVETGAIRESFYHSVNRTWSAPVRWLPAGHYTLQFTGGSGAARFTVRDLAHATAIATDTPVAVDLAANDAFEAFDVVLKAELNTYLCGLTGAGANDWFRLYDTAGTLLTQGNPSSANPLTLDVPRDGHYLLIVARNTTATAGGTALRFELPSVPKGVTPISVDDTITGRFVTGSERREYSFTVSEATQLVLTENSSTGPAKTYWIVDAKGNIVDTLGNGGKAWGLAAGNYTLCVQSNYHSIPILDDRFNATLTATGVARTLSVDANATLQLTNGVADGVLKLELEAGQSYWLTTVPTLSAGQVLKTAVFDPSGNQVSQANISGSAGATGIRITPAQSGTYTIALGGLSGALNSAYTFKLERSQAIDEALPLGSEATGTFAQAADKATYRFSLAEPTRVWLNVAGDNYDASLVRTDIADTVIGVQNLYGSDIMRVLELPAGSYEIRLQARQGQPRRLPRATDRRRGASRARARRHGQRHRRARPMGQRLGLRRCCR